MQKPTIRIFHVGGGGGGEVGELAGFLNLAQRLNQEPNLEITIFDVIEEEDYTDLTYLQSIPGVTAQLVPLGLSRSRETRSFRINRHPLSSSVFPPAALTKMDNPGYGGISTWAENTEAKRIIDVELHCIDDLIASGVLRNSPDVLSLDIQGLEYGVMQGAENALRASILAVISEGELAEIYQGQGMFDEQLGYLRQMNFRFVDFLTSQRWYQGPAIGSGCLTVVEAVFIRWITDNFESGLGESSCVGARPIENEQDDALVKLVLVSAGLDLFSYTYRLIGFISEYRPSLYADLESSSWFNPFREFFDRVRASGWEHDLTHMALRARERELLGDFWHPHMRGAAQVPSLWQDAKTHLKRIAAIRKLKAKLRH